jgi:hypothetical protein
MGMVRVIREKGDERVHWKEEAVESGESLANSALTLGRTHLWIATRQGSNSFPRRAEQTGLAHRAV